ncbi:MAG: hypothetical protein HKO90_03405 [Flavobacteriaceae bacterium]|nr:hypothetical protein [Flavobacteriaceae bacterium]
MKRLKTIISMICMLSVVLYSCKSEVDQESGEQSEQSENYQKVTPDDIGDLKFTEYVLSDKAVDVTKDWLKFKELNNQIELLKTSDLSFFADDITLLEGFLTDLEAEIPEILKETSILVRLSALKTTIYKFEGSATLQRESKEAVLQSISDLLVAHSNLIFQINKKLEKDAQQIQKPQ